MFSHTGRSAALFLFCWLLLSFSPLEGQIRNPREGDSEQTAIGLYREGDYREALMRFRALDAAGQGGAVHDYYLGCCLVALGEDLDEAIERLHGVLTSVDVPNDVAFYLGRAHQLNYNFTEALKYFNRFEAESSRQQQREYGVNQQKASCRSAMEITSSYNPYELMNVTFLDLTDSAQFSQIKMKGGQLVYKPDLYRVEGETREDLTGLMFLPVSTVRGEYAFFSGYERNRKEGAQLFRIRKGTGNNWGEPEAIRSLNTEGDELLPYFDPIEDDLYFSSNGLPGVGGFDLYRSHYDSDRDEWSEPMNVGFPVNSTRDEFLLLPGSDLGMVMFFTNRQGGDSLVTVYRVHLVEPRVAVDNRDFIKLGRIASMGGVAEELLAELRELEATPYREPAKSETLVTEAPVEEPPPVKPVITPVKILEQEENVGRDRLSECMQHQEKADSLKGLAVAATIRVRESDDPNDRWVWQKQILLWEKKSSDEEFLADQCFARMEAMEARQLQQMGSYPPTIEPDTVIGEMTVYRFAGASSLEGEPGEAPAPVSETREETEVINRFDILDHSPYGPANPVPMDVSLPPGTFYRIQLGVYSGEVEAATFKGITPITGERMEGRGLVKYYAGKFSRYSDASYALERIQSVGFGDAFIVAWYNGTQVPTHQAKQLE